MAVPTTPIGASADETRSGARLLAVLERLARIAEAVLRKVRFLLLLATLSAVWLTYFLQQLFGFEWIGLAVTATLFGVPALILLYGYIALLDVVELPTMVKEIGGAMKDAASPLLKRLNGTSDQTEQEAPPRGKLRQLLRAGGILLELSRIGALPEATRAALAVTNPLFITLLGVAYVAAILLALLASVTALIHFA